MRCFRKGHLATSSRATVHCPVVRKLPRPAGMTRFTYRRRGHMRVEFFSGSRLCSKRFFYRCASFPSLSKSAIPHSNSIKRVVKGIFVTRD